MNRNFYTKIIQSLPIFINKERYFLFLEQQKAKRRPV